MDDADADLRLGGATAPFVFRGATDAAAFETYAEKVLAPHKAAAVLKAVHRAGAEVIPLPTPSPDSSPIEEMSSKLKGESRSAAARSIDAIGDALRNTTPQDIVGWFNSRAMYAMR